MTAHTSIDANMLSGFLTYRIARVQSRLNAQATKLLGEVSGISLTQWRILALIATQGEPISAELVALVGMDKGLFSRKLKTLVAEGLVQSRPDPNDHRVMRLQLTEAGREIYETTLPHMQARQERLKASLEADELDAFYRVIDKLMVQLDAEAE